MYNFKGKTAIVTGATRGIGEAITIKLYNLGCNVIGIYKTRDDLANEIMKKYSNIKMIKADVSKEDEVKKIVKASVNQFHKIDILINNVGIYIGGFIRNYSIENWREIVDVNLTSKFLMCKYCIPCLEKSKGAVIINISSRYGLDKYIEPLSIAYGITNAGINIFTYGLSKELEKTGIRVNAVIPTVTDTDRFKNSFTREEQDYVKKKGKLGKAEEVADLVINLIKDKKANRQIKIDKRVYL